MQCKEKKTHTHKRTREAIFITAEEHHRPVIYMVKLCGGFFFLLAFVRVVVSSLPVMIADVVFVVWSLVLELFSPFCKKAERKRN